MRDIAKDAYEKCAIGATSWMRPDPGKGVTLESFQTVADLTAPELQASGLIHILSKHRESQTGLHLVDAIQFVRIK